MVFNPSTHVGRGRQITANSRSTWSTKWVKIQRTLVPPQNKINQSINQSQDYTEDVLKAARSPGEASRETNSTVWQDTNRTVRSLLWHPTHSSSNEAEPATTEISKWQSNRNIFLLITHYHDKAVFFKRLDGGGLLAPPSTNSSCNSWLLISFTPWTMVCHFLFIT